MSSKKAQKAAAKAAPKTAVEESDDNSDDEEFGMGAAFAKSSDCLLYTSPSPRDS